MSKINRVTKLFIVAVFWLSAFVSVSIDSRVYAVVTNLCGYPTNCNGVSGADNCGGSESTYWCSANSGACFAAVTSSPVYRLRVYASNNDGNCTICDGSTGCTMVQDRTAGTIYLSSYTNTYCRVQIDVIRDSDAYVVDHIVWRDASKCSAPPATRYNCVSYSCQADANGAYGDISSCTAACQAPPGVCGPNTVATAYPGPAASGVALASGFNWTYSSYWCSQPGANCSYVNVYLWPFDPQTDPTYGFANSANYYYYKATNPLPPSGATGVVQSQFACRDLCIDGWGYCRSGSIGACIDHPMTLSLQPSTTYWWRVVPGPDPTGTYCYFTTTTCSPVNGGWSWGPCVGTCGTGTITGTCNNPAPSCGGAACTPPSTLSCPLPACPTCSGATPSGADWVTPTNSPVTARTAIASYSTPSSVTWSPAIGSLATASSCAAGTSCSITVSAAGTTNYGSTSLSMATSPASNPVCTNKPICVVQKPLTPVAGTATSVTDTSATVGWSFSTITGSNPIAYWKMNEASGQTVADSAGFNTGTAVGTTVTAGEFGSARSLNGASDYINMGNVPLPTGSITLEAWVKPNVVNTYQRIIDRTNGGASGISVLINNDGRIRYQLKTATMTELYSVTYLQMNTWYYVVATYDGSYMRISINGVPDNSVAKTGTISYDNINTYVGAYSYSTPGQFFNGVIDEVGIYNYVRSPAQILEDMGPVSKRGCTYDSTCSSCSYDYLVEWGTSSGNYPFNSGWLVPSPWNYERASYNMTGLACNTTYYWRVRRGTGYTGVESASSEFTFTTTAGANCGPPVGQIYFRNADGSDLANRVKVVNPPVTVGLNARSYGYNVSSVAIEESLVTPLAWSTLPLTYSCGAGTCTISNPSAWTISDAPSSYGNYYLATRGVNSIGTCVGYPSCCVGSYCTNFCTGAGLGSYYDCGNTSPYTGLVSNKDSLLLVVCPSKGSCDDPSANSVVLGAKTTRGEVLSATTAACAASGVCDILSSTPTSFNVTVPWPSPYYACMAGKVVLQISTDPTFATGVSSATYYRVSDTDTGLKLGGTGSTIPLAGGSYTLPLADTGLTPLRDIMYYWRVVRQTATSGDETSGDLGIGQASSARQFVIASQTVISGNVRDVTSSGSDCSPTASDGVGIGTGGAVTVTVTATSGTNSVSTTTVNPSTGAYTLPPLSYTGNVTLAVTVSGAGTPYGAACLSSLSILEADVTPTITKNIAVHQIIPAWVQVVNGDIYFKGRSVPTEGINVSVPAGQSLLTATTPAPTACGVAVTASSVGPSTGAGMLAK